MKKVTAVNPVKLPFSITHEDRIMVLGSCFATNVGTILSEDGFDVCNNPFGNLFNPWSIADSVERLESAEPFTDSECIEMGAGAGKICSFSHHTSFARKTREEFLENANSSLVEASRAWKDATAVIITFGTAQVWKHEGRVVSNCLKRPNYEFSHEMLSLDEVKECIGRIVRPGRKFIFTVSPIRHLGEGSIVNSVSKSTLILAISQCGVPYYPSYEIMMDELRDYSWYAEDLVHPSEEAVATICSRFRRDIVTF